MPEGAWALKSSRNGIVSPPPSLIRATSNHEYTFPSKFVGPKLVCGWSNSDPPATAGDAKNSMAYMAETQRIRSALPTIVRRGRRRGLANPLARMRTAGLDLCPPLGLAGNPRRGLQCRYRRHGEKREEDRLIFHALFCVTDPLPLIPPSVNPSMRESPATLDARHLSPGMEARNRHRDIASNVSMQVARLGAAGSASSGVRGNAWAAPRDAGVLPQVS